MKSRGGLSATARLGCLLSLCFATAAAFSSPCFVQQRLPTITTTTSRPHFQGGDSPSFTRLGSSSSSNDSTSSIWQPTLRKVMAGIAAAGALETGYLTLSKYTGNQVLCGVDGGGGNNNSCQDVLQGPYSTLPFTDHTIPLSLLGCLAYITVAVLAMQPLLNVQDDDDDDDDNDLSTVDDSFNRVALTTVTTTMATFSVGLMILLLGVLQTSCPYCIFSATCSILLAKVAWIGGCYPKASRGNGPVAGFLTATLGTALLFVSGGADINDNSSLTATTATTSPSSFLLLASSKSSKQQQQQQQQLYRPPDIETESSTQALQLADELERLDAKMYGAYWCSHCFDQKETLGKQAFAKIPYVECSKEGIQSQSKLCKEQRIPGYPTWQIQGQLYPGEQSLEELQELVQTIQREGSSSSSS